MPGRSGAVSVMRAPYSASPAPFPPGRAVVRLDPSTATRCPMPDSPTWPARLDHVRLDSDDPARLAAFYRDPLGMRPSPLGDGTTLLGGPRRRIVIGKGAPGAQPFIAYRL